jgi:hypothetical protein
MENTETKVCSKCNLEKSLSDFYFRMDRNKYTEACKSCVRHDNRVRHWKNRDTYNKARKQYRQNNLDHVKEIDQKSRKKNRENRKLRQNEKYWSDDEYRQNHIKYNRVYYRQNLQRSMFAKASKRAKEKSIEFNITIDDIVIPDVCPVLGIPIFVGGLVSKDNSPSLDRIDNTKGYIKGNVMVISYRANAIKNYGSAEEHRLIAKYIEENLSLDTEDYAI